MRVNPLEGTMAGLLIAAKNADRVEAKVVDLFGGKKTKHRWYELDHEHFKWCAGHEKEAEYKGQVSVGTVVEVHTLFLVAFIVYSVCILHLSVF